jgi:hypothetical protein
MGDVDDASAGPAELLEHGPVGPPRPWSRRRWLAVAAAVALLAIAIATDRWVHAGEVRSARANLAAAEQAADHADGLLQSTFQYSSPLIVSTRASDSVRSALRALVMQAAADGAAELRAVRTSVAGTSVLPWHSDVWRSREATLAFLDAKIAFLAAGSRDYSRLDEAPPGVASALDQARALSP